MAKVYVSSTVADLKQERRAVMDWLVAAGHLPVHSYLPNSDTVRDSCLEDVDSCDLYVLIVGHRYGFQPAQDNPESLSITHLEFRRAGQSGIPRIALLRTSIPDVSLSDLENPQRIALVSTFRKEVGRRVRPAEFGDLQGLIQGLSTGIQAELDKLGKRDERQDARAARPANAADGSLSLARMADRLAIAVGTQWEAEARIRRLNDPYPLPVSWAAADASLSDDWDSLVKLATTGAGWLKDPDVGSWAAGPDDLAGVGNELAEVLARVPTGRLVMLGEPGAGKTMLMVQLILDLLARRVSGGPVPVLVSLASWSSAKAGQDLRGWLAAQLALNYPFLAAAAPPGAGEGTCIDVLLGAKPSLILPILDGLDEIPDAVRGPAIARINDALKPRQQMVVTCRTEQYKDAIWPPGGVRTTVTAAAAIQLCPLDADAVSDYLLETGGPGAAERWHPVLTALGTQEPVAQVLNTPLMIALARAIYNPRAGEVTGELRDPAELCRLADKAAVEAQLLDAFVPAAYRSGLPCPWTTEQAETWLVFLARHLERTIRNPDFAWWQLQYAMPPIGTRLAAGLGPGVVAGVLSGTAVGLAGGLVVPWAGGVAGGIAAGVIAGVAAGVAAGVRGVTRPSRGVRVRIGRLAGGLAGGVVAGVVVVDGVNTLPGNAMSAMGVLVLGLVFGAGFGLAAGLVFGLRAVPSDLAVAASPGAVLARDRRAALLQGLTAGVVALLVASLVALLVSGFSLFSSAFGTYEAAFVFGLVFGLVAGYGFNAAATAWPSYVLARGWLALRHRLPWRLMRFLADAHRRGVLRQAGAVYQFRHIELQHRLANRAVDKQ
jgi:hypothetical protein